MFYFLLLLFLFSLPVSLIFTIFPSSLNSIVKKDFTRKKIALYLIGYLFVLFVLMVFTAPPNTETKTKAPKPSQQATKTPTNTTVQKHTSTPTPSDWVSNPLCEDVLKSKDTNGLDYDECLRDKYPLKATLKADDLALYITNTQSVNWTDCQVSLRNSNYAMNGFDYFSVDAASTTRLPWGRLTDENGNRFDYTKTQPGTIDITCTVNHEMYSASFTGF